MGDSVGLGCLVPNPCLPVLHAAQPTCMHMQCKLLRSCPQSPCLSFTHKHPDTSLLGAVCNLFPEKSASSVRQRSTAPSPTPTCCCSTSRRIVHGIQQAQQCYVGMWVRSTCSTLRAVPKRPWGGLYALLTEAVTAAQVKGALRAAVVAVETDTALKHIMIHAVIRGVLAQALRSTSEHSQS